MNLNFNFSRKHISEDIYDRRCVLKLLWEMRMLHPHQGIPRPCFMADQSFLCHRRLVTKLWSSRRHAPLSKIIIKKIGIFWFTYVRPVVWTGDARILCSKYECGMLCGGRWGGGALKAGRGTLLCNCPHLSHRCREHAVNQRPVSLIHGLEYWN